MAAKTSALDICGLARTVVAVSVYFSTGLVDTVDAWTFRTLTTGMRPVYILIVSYVSTGATSTSFPLVSRITLWFLDDGLPLSLIRLAFGAWIVRTLLGLVLCIILVNQALWLSEEDFP
ncbi:hypothetical protein NEOLEDRAFT_1143536 [Neolentinus lepideus HHB14362 ss-1]|uniref:Uncharacterized protein n=1 Tax=Neolentinus lepideus HHB14362 ss-1 TaxID=1314782 RepID=A0A165MGM6_9AGAM|nr:hypothetical protein NEOLEDRAFT_1143536 [Neolentinus lepideus HHB14362 ss-1]